ncbi:MAG: response regulator [Chloroflexota bacterium]
MEKCLLVIDDDPTIADYIRFVVPDWTVLVAYNGVEGIALAHEWSTRIDIIILDITMPHSGTLVAAQIRTALPTIPILVYTNGANAVDTQTLEALGCPSPISKDINTSTLRECIYTTAQQLLQPPDRNLLLPFLLQTATESEQTFRHNHPPTVPLAALAAPGIIRTTIQTVVSGSGHTLRIITSDTASLQAQLTQRHVDIIIADSSLQSMAQGIAQQFQIPLLIVARSMSTAFRIVGDSVIVIDVLTREVVQDAVATILAEQRYVSPELKQVLELPVLNDLERKIIQRYLQNIEPKVIADQLGIAKDTVYHRWNSICTKLGVRDVIELTQWVDQWQERDRPSTIK